MLMRYPFFSVFAASFIVWCFALLPAVAQDYEHPPATEVQPGETASGSEAELEEAIEAPVPETALPRLPLRPNEAMYEGTIEAISFAERRFILRATDVTYPKSESTLSVTPTPLQEPGYTTVLFDPQQPIAAAPYPTDGSEPKWISAGVLWTRRLVAVAAPAAAPGTPVRARLIELGDVQSYVTPIAQPQPHSTRYFGGVREHVAATGLRTGPKLGVTSFSGVSARAANPNSDHPRGLALDFMVGRNAKRGDLVASYFEANMGMENVAYIIWKDTIAHPGARTDWAKLSVDYGPGMTARHMDHIHVSFLAAPLTPGPWLTVQLLRSTQLSARGGQRAATPRKRQKRRPANKSRRLRR